ncbi:hypothetical protein K470DRAFT_259965 [Piedraia hortae CBS 480.64]|uniref:Uncharacterized protein n=1 Tax=Piedraia hortae CBS 480.64 TaxID=1314780 RepID=A0A6A7BSJ4_9PEZI|nr:hypothetical protein K470DRAFT_259965 [Piedraia hortae CBS 480.64]
MTVSLENKERFNRLCTAPQPDQSDTRQVRQMRSFLYVGDKRTISATAQALWRPKWYRILFSSGVHYTSFAFLNTKFCHERLIQYVSALHHFSTDTSVREAMPFRHSTAGHLADEVLDLLEDFAAEAMTVDVEAATAHVERELRELLECLLVDALRSCLCR